MRGNGGDHVLLAVIDLTALEGDSNAAVERMISLAPELRVLLAGGLEPGPLPAVLEGRVCGRLLKPFRLEELASAVAVALAGN